MDPATGAPWPRLPLIGGTGFRPRPAIHGQESTHTVVTVPPNSPVEDAPPSLMPPVPFPMDRVIQQLDGHSNSGYQTDDTLEIEVVNGTPGGVADGPDLEPVS